MQDHPAAHSLELMPQQGTGQAWQSDRQLAQDKPKSPGLCWVSQRVLDTVEEHLAQEVHGLEDVLHGVDPACLGEEGEWATGSRQGTRVQPGCTQNHTCYPLALHNRAQPGIRHCSSSLQQLHTSLGNAPDGISWENPLQQPQVQRQPPDSSKTNHGCVPCCSPATQDSSGLKCDLSGTAVPAPGLAQKQFPHCRDSGAEAWGTTQLPPNTNISGTKGRVPLMDEQDRQTLHCCDLDPPCPSQDTNSRELQDSALRGDAAPHPPWMALGPCSPLLLLSWAVQGQLGTVTGGPVPP